MFSRTDRGDRPVDELFTEELTQLKRRGASVLVVGSVRAEQRRRVCRRLLGEASAQPRRRVLVSTTGDDRDVARLVEPATDAPENLRLVRYAAGTRSGPPDDSDAPETGPVRDATVESAIEPTTLPELGIAIARAIDDFETDAEGLAPAELRVGVDSLAPLLEEYDVERVFKFVHLTNGRTRETDGMIHYHLPLESDADVVSVFAPLFDVVVELRERNGVFQERWSINDGEYSSGWISIGRSPEE